MILVIDASNIVAGGGLVHLTELLRVANPSLSDFETVIVCAPTLTLNKIQDKPWLEKRGHILLNDGYSGILKWRKTILWELVRSENAFLFVLGALKPPFRWPYVTMCQNLLPLELKEAMRFGFSKVTLRLLLLRIFHVRAYRNASGVIFLTSYCYQILSSRIQKKIKRHTIIPHGINHALFPALYAARQSDPSEFKLLYVSIIDVYKHQDKIVEAVINLNRKGYNISLTLAGPNYPPYFKGIQALVLSAGDLRNKIFLTGSVDYEKMKEVYANHDAFIFASTCETFGMILTEAMATGMPIACSEKSSLPETLRNAGIYFDPEDKESVEDVILKLAKDEGLRKELSNKAIERARLFTWENCANKTFTFLNEISKLSFK